MKPASSIFGLALAIIAGYYSEPYVKGLILPASSTVTPAPSVDGSEAVSPPNADVPPTPQVETPSTEVVPAVEPAKDESLPIPQATPDALPIPVDEPAVAKTEEKAPEKTEEKTPTIVVPDETTTQPTESKEQTTTKEETPEPSADEINPTTNVDPAVQKQVIAAMQQSIRGGAISEFSYNQITQWQVGPAEAFQGAEYQTGLAYCKSETIFGVKVLGAKALIKDGKVVRWTWAKSGMEIK